MCYIALKRSNKTVLVSKCEGRITSNHALHFGLLLVLSPGFETTTAGTKMYEKQ
jgi:hypothetical protein